MSLRVAIGGHNARAGAHAAETGNENWQLLLWQLSLEPNGNGDGHPNIEEYLNMLAKDDFHCETRFDSSRQLPAPDCGRG